jgi:hypothetical protein
MITPPKEAPGKTIEQRRYNALLRYVKGLKPIAGKGIRISHTTTGTVVESTAAEGEGGANLWG